VDWIEDPNAPVILADIESDASSTVASRSAQRLSATGFVSS
jgi:hypothetical protein